jgi:hypothetical protein
VPQRQQLRAQPRRPRRHAGRPRPRRGRGHAQRRDTVRASPPARAQRRAGSTCAQRSIVHARTRTHGASSRRLSLPPPSASFRLCSLSRASQHVLGGVAPAAALRRRPAGAARRRRVGARDRLLAARGGERASRGREPPSQKPDPRGRPRRDERRTARAPPAAARRARALERSQRADVGRLAGLARRSANPAPPLRRARSLLPGPAVKHSNVRRGTVSHRRTQ